MELAFYKTLFQIRWKICLLTWKSSNLITYVANLLAQSNLQSDNCGAWVSQSAIQWEYCSLDSISLPAARFNQSPLLADLISILIGCKTFQENIKLAGLAWCTATEKFFEYCPCCGFWRSHQTILIITYFLPFFPVRSFYTSCVRTKVK